MTSSVRACAPTCSSKLNPWAPPPDPRLKPGPVFAPSGGIITPTIPTRVALRRFSERARVHCQSGMPLHMSCKSESYGKSLDLFRSCTAVARRETWDMRCRISIGHWPVVYSPREIGPPELLQQHRTPENRKANPSSSHFGSTTDMLSGCCALISSK